MGKKEILKYEKWKWKLWSPVREYVYIFPHFLNLVTFSSRFPLSTKWTPWTGSLDKMLNIDTLKCILLSSYFPLAALGVVACIWCCLGHIVLHTNRGHMGLDEFFSVMCQKLDWQFALQTIAASKEGKYFLKDVHSDQFRIPPIHLRFWFWEKVHIFLITSCKMLAQMDLVLGRYEPKSRSNLNRYL